MKSEKVSVSLPADLVAEARQRANGNLSSYLAESLRRRVLADRLGEYLVELDEEFGPLTGEELAQARHLWRDEV